MKTSKSVRHLYSKGFVLGVFTLTLGIPAYASDPPGYPDNILAFDPREIAKLPPYCKHTQVFESSVPGGQNAVEQGRFKALMGPTFYHMHHYCQGLMLVNRANISRTQVWRQRYLLYSINEFDYVLERAPADFVLLPEILTKKGESLIRLGKGTLAVLDLERAIEVKPDYWPPYAALSDYYKSRGDLVKARELVEKALPLAPNAMKRRLHELESAKARQKP